MRLRFPAESLFLLILVLAFALRMGVVVNNLQADLSTDEHEYFDRAELAATDVGRDRAVFRPPLYPYTLALWFQPMGDSRFAIGTFQTLADLVSLALLAKLARFLFARREIALITALTFAVSPETLSFDGTILSEPFFICLMLAGFVLVLYATKRTHWGLTLLAGIVLALASLTREVIAYFALAAIPVWWILFSAASFRTRFAQGLVFLCGLMLVFAPWMVRNQIIAQRFLFISTSGEYNFIRDNVRTAAILEAGARTIELGDAVRKQVRTDLDALPPPQQASYAYKQGLNAIAQTGLYWLGYKAAVTGSFWNPFQFEKQNLGLTRLPPALIPFVSWLIVSYLIALLVFATIGLIAAPDDRYKLVIALFLLYSLGLFLVTHFQTRYRYPLHIMMLPYAAYGVWCIHRLLHTRHFDVHWITAPRLVVSALVLLLFVPLITFGAP